MQTRPSIKPPAVGRAMDAKPSRPRYLALLDRAEVIGGLGSWEWTPETDVLVWSDNHFRLFGLEPRSVVPSSELVLGQMHHQDHAHFEAALAEMATGDAVKSVDYRMVRQDGMVRHFHATVASIAASEGHPRRLVGSIQDVTETYLGDRKLKAYTAVSRTIDEWEEFDTGAQTLLSALASALDLQFGTLWVPEPDALSPRVIWHQRSPSLAGVAEATSDWRPGHGCATLGRAWSSRQPVVCADPCSGSPPPRADAIREAGLSVVLAIPAVAVDETLAVLEFFSCDPVEVTVQLKGMLTGIGHELGYFLAQHRGELGGPLLTPREVEVLQLAADGLGVTEIAEALFLSPATIKRHFERAYARLGVSGRAAAVAAAMRQGSIV